MKPTTSVSLAAILCTVVLALHGCSGSGDANRLDSEDYSDQQERVAVLKDEIVAASGFEDAAFKLFNVNGFSNDRTLIPGASSWDYQFAVKVNPVDVNQWTEGLEKGKPYDDTWTTALVASRKEAWQTSSTPEFYTRANSNVTLIVYRPEGIIFKRVVNL